jgi:hypothetical protein
LESKQPAVSYYIYISLWSLFALQSLTLAPDNSQTNEQLVIKGDQRDGYLKVSRYPSGASDEWIDEISEIPNNTYRNIVFRF